MVHVLIFILIFIIFLFIFNIVPIKKCAEWLKAEHTSYGRATLCFVVSALVSIGLQFIINVLGFGAALTMVLSVVLGILASAKTYSTILGATFGRGAGIMFASGAITFVLYLILMLGFILFGFGSSVGEVMKHVPSGARSVSSEVESTAIVRQELERAHEADKSTEEIES